MKKLFLLYCLAISVFISVAGFLTGKEQNIPFQIIFLPVPLYLLFTLFSDRKNKSESKKHIENLLLYVALFAALLFISLVNIFKLYSS